MRDALDATFRAPAFARSFGARLWDRIVELFRELTAALHGSPLASRPTLWIVAALVTAAVGAALWRWWQRRERAARRAGTRGADAVASAPWRAADAAIAAGDWEGATHLLYAAVIDALAARGLVRPHPSRTPGDYARELRARARRGGPDAAAAARVAPAYTPFARGFETLAFGPHAPDAAGVAALRALAASIVAPDSAPPAAAGDPDARARAA